VIRSDFTFSKSALTESCTWWLAAGVPWDESESEAARGGTIVHHAIARLVNTRVDQAPEKPELAAMYAQARTWLKENGILNLAGLRAEVAYAYDVATDTSRELVDPAGWETRWYANPARRAAYDGPGGPIRATEICTRLDLVCFGCDGAGGFLRTWDLKCHFKPGEHLDARAQLESCSLAAARVPGRDGFGIDRVQAAAIHVWTDRAAPEVLPELDAFALGDIAARVWALANRPANDSGASAAVPGPHCDARFCPARAACPETSRTVTELIPVERLARRPLAGPLQDNDHAAWALVGADLFEEIAKQLRAKADAWADAHAGIRTSDGKVYSGQPVPSERADLTVPGSIDALKNLGFVSALKTTTTWTELKKEGGSEGEKLAREALRAIHAVKVSTSMRYEARTPKPSDAASTVARRAS
jgi:hypothetical protein